MAEPTAGAASTRTRRRGKPAHESLRRPQLRTALLSIPQSGPRRSSSRGGALQAIACGRPHRCRSTLADAPAEAADPSSNAPNLTGPAAGPATTCASSPPPPISRITASMTCSPRSGRRAPPGDNRRLLAADASAARTRPPRYSAIPMSSCWTSPPTASIPKGSAVCGTTCAASPRRDAPCSSRVVCWPRSPRPSMRSWSWRPAGWSPTPAVGLLRDRMVVRVRTPDPTALRATLDARGNPIWHRRAGARPRCTSETVERAIAATRVDHEISQEHTDLELAFLNLTTTTTGAPP